MPSVDVLSFFIVILILGAIILPMLWNSAFTSLAVKKIGVGTGILFIATWFCFVTTALVLLESLRDMLAPGLWEKERLFSTPFQSASPASDSLMSDLLLGWWRFPARTFAEADVSLAGVVTAVAALILTLVLTETLGRSLMKSRWQSRWTGLFLAAFLLADVVTFASLAVVRQIFWFG